MLQYSKIFYTFASEKGNYRYCTIYDKGSKMKCVMSRRGIGRMSMPYVPTMR